MELDAMTCSSSSSTGGKSNKIIRNSTAAVFSNSQSGRVNSENAAPSATWWSRPSPSKSSRLSASANAMSKSFSGAESSSANRGARFYCHSLASRNNARRNILQQNPPLAVSAAAKQDSNESWAWGSSVIRKIRSLWYNSNSSLASSQIDKEELEGRRVSVVMTTSTPGAFDYSDSDNNGAYGGRESSSGVWGGSLQRKLAHLRHQQDDCMSLASLDAMESKSTNSPFSTMKKSTDSCHLEQSSNESMFSSCGVQHNRLSFAGCYPSSDDSHSLERHYGSIRRSSRKEKAQKGKPSSALTSSLMHSSAPLLRPLFFEVPQGEEDPPFIGRHWLFKQILTGLMNEQKPGFLLIGNQGTGKTAFLLQLVEQSCFGRGHVIHSDEQMNNMRCDEMFTLSQLVVGYHFCQADNSITCYVPEFVHSLAAQLYQAPQMDAYRQQLLTETHLQNLVSIEECIADPDRAFCWGILEPLSLLAEHDRISSSTPSVILIDALGEAEYHRPDHTSSLTAFLVKHMSSFPPWLKIIATVQTPLQKVATQLPFQRISLDRLHANENLQRDMLEYIRYRVRTSGRIQSSISSPSSSLNNSLNGTLSSSSALTATPLDHVHSKFAMHLSTLAQGSVLFARLTLDLMEAGQLVAKAQGYRVLPTSLHQLFLLRCNLRFASDSAFARVQPLLAVCLASLHPLNLIEIYHSVTSLQTEPDNWDAFAEKFEMLQGLLVKRTDDTYMFFHPSFREWLIKGGGNEENKYVCDVKKGHAGIALRFCRVQQPLDAEKTLEMSHHILKAHIFKNAPNMPTGLSSRDMQALWLLNSSQSITDALCCARNVYSPNDKVSRLLLLSGGNANAQTDALGGVPILCAAAHLGFADLATSLLEFGASATLTDAKGATPLILAAAAGHQHICSILLKTPGADSLVALADDTGQCALVHAALGGHLEVVRSLLNVQWAPPTVETPFQIGTPSNKDEALIVEKTGVDKTQAKHQALVAAASKGQTEIVLCLLEDRKVPIDIPDTLSGETALTAAAAGGHVVTCQTLLQKSASVMVPNDKGLMPLCVAVKEGHWSTAEIILQKGVPVDQADYHGRTPLIYASAEGHLNIVQQLLHNRASIQRTDRDGANALWHACHKGRAQVAKFLIECGADVNQSDKSGRAPLDAAATQCNPQIVELLLEHNAAIDRTDSNGLRPLERAILSNNIPIVQCFLKKRACIVSATWQTAQGKPEILLMLLHRLLEDGNTLYKKGRLQEAAGRFYYAIKKLPPTSAQNSCEPFLLLHLQLLLNLSRCNRKMNNCDEAVRLADLALTIRPDSFEALFAKARALLALGELRGAHEDTMQALALAPAHNRTARNVLFKLREQIEKQIQSALD